MCPIDYDPNGSKQGLSTQGPLCLRFSSVWKMQALRKVSFATDLGLTRHKMHNCCHFKHFHLFFYITTDGTSFSLGVLAALVERSLEFCLLNGSGLCQLLAEILGEMFTFLLIFLSLKHGLVALPRTTKVLLIKKYFAFNMMEHVLFAVCFYIQMQYNNQSAILYV